MPIKERYIKMAKVKPVQKKKMSKPALAAIIISVILLIALVLSLMAGSGFFFRYLKKGASSNNFEINASMMEYYTNSYVQNWYSQNYYYIMLGYIKFDMSKPLNEQYTDSSNTQTYYDYFVQGTKTTITTYLKYCEAARLDDQVDFKKLESDAEAYAKESLDKLQEAAKAESQKHYAENGQSITFEEYIRNNFGEHVSKNDIKKALIIEHIASDYYEIMHERIEGTIDADREQQYFDEHLSQFISAEYIIYTLSSLKTVNFPAVDDYVGGKDAPAYLAAIDGLTPEKIAELKIDPADYEGGEESAAYKKAYETAAANKKANDESLAKDKAVIDRLSSAETLDEFKRIILEERYESSFTSSYNTAIKNFGANDKPATGTLAAFKTDALKNAIIAAVLNGDDDIDSSVINLEEVKKDIFEEKFDKYFESAYNTASKDFADADKPSDDALKAFMTSELKTAIINAALNGEENVNEELIVVGEGASEKWTAAAKELPKAIITSLKANKWPEAAANLPKAVITALNKEITNATRTTSYTLTSVLGNKLFGGVKAEYGIDYEGVEVEGTNAPVNSCWQWNVLEMNLQNYELSKKIALGAIDELAEEIANETDADKKKALEDEKKTLEENLAKIDENIEKAKTKIENAPTTGEYSYSAFFVTKAAHNSSDYKLRDVSHILFKVDSTKDTDPEVSYKTSEEAKAAAEKLLAEIRAEADLTKEKFEAFGEVTHDGKVSYEDVAKGQMVEEYEDWLYAATTVGELGLVETPYGWHIMYYAGEAEEVLWRETAKEGATDEELNDWYEGLPDYGIEINDELFPEIFHINHNHKH